MGNVQNKPINRKL